MHRSLEDQTRRLADLCFVLGDYDSALQHYKSAANDYKNDKAHEAFASTQEMIAATLLRDPARSGAAIARRDALNIVAYLGNAFSGYERASALLYAQRVALLQQLVLRLAGEHLQAADVCVRGAELPASDELYEAIMQEQTALCYLYRQPSPSERRCTFRLVVAGACYDGAGAREHALRCYALAFAAYESSGWPLINAQLHSLLVRHYGN